MQIVIDIPEEEYNIIKNAPITWLEHVIANGVPLPKGHGDLKDINNLKHAFIMWSMLVQGNFTNAYIANIIYNSPTIIEADTPKKIKGTPLEENDNGYNCENWIP